MNTRNTALLALLSTAAVMRPAVAQDRGVAFRRHTINAASEFTACAVMDVDHDGQPDIVAGAFWYRGPDWTRHRLRDVPMIGNRYDDYSNVPLDVDADGWTDLISVNYRSRSIFWIQHPGPSLGEWKTVLVDQPGPSETGRLVDVDGDGAVDVLPNGTTYAAWYELKRGGERELAGQTLQWIRHDLPAQLAAHGIGFGDIDGDGRGDVVGPNGWAEAPEDRRQGRWIWHDEFVLNRDCSIPILVLDVDDDSDNDLVWGRGHDIGLYWCEQQLQEDKRVWIRHAIDTSWSQAHSLLVADIDGNGRPDVVTGKRYLGHEGRDPGEYDPMAIYGYQFDPTARTWQRHLVSFGDRCGFDLDPKCADIDADGDVDIVTPSRGGLYLLENLGPLDAAAATAVQAEQEAQANSVPDYDHADHAQLLMVKSPEGAREPITTGWQWGLRRWHILRQMERVMGPLPDPSRRVPLDVQVLDEHDAGSYIRRRITYAAEPGDRVPAYLLVPKDLPARAAAMLCLHPTSPLGKDQLCALGGNSTNHYAHELAQRGYVCLVPDYPSFGEYAAYDFDQDDYVSGTMKGIWNHVRGVDLLQSLPEVDPDRVGAIGHSLGGHNALFVAAFDQRIRAVVTSCGFNAFEDYYGGNLTGWTSARYMPRIRDEYGSDPQRMPFDFHEVLGAMAPRPLFICAPLGDENFAAAGVRKAAASAAEVYRFLDAEANLVVRYPDTGHVFPDEIRDELYEWLDGKLAGRNEK